MYRFVKYQKNKIKISISLFYFKNMEKKTIIIITTPKDLKWCQIKGWIRTRVANPNTQIVDTWPLRIRWRTIRSGMAAYVVRHLLAFANGVALKLPIVGLLDVVLKWCRTLQYIFGMITCQVIEENFETTTCTRCSDTYQRSYLSGWCVNH